MGDHRRPKNFYPRPPRGGRQILDIVQIYNTTISIHALREEGDGSAWAHSSRQRISIHALREEGDPREKQSMTFPPNFYPRAPRGGRRHKPKCIQNGGLFLSTPSARRATRIKAKTRFNLILFLSTPSARRATLSVRVEFHNAFEFLSTPSARRATGGRGGPGGAAQISIHALREEGDCI